MLDIRYATRADGVRTAYGLLGHGPVLLIPPGLLSHLEWWDEAPGAGPFLRCLAEHRTVVLYDAHGCGLSDRDRTDFSIADDMKDLEAVVEALGTDAIEIIGISRATGLAIAFAAAEPRKLRRLVLYGAGLRRNGMTNNVANHFLDMDLDQFVRFLAVMLFPSGPDEATFRSFVRIHEVAATPEVQCGFLANPLDFEPLIADVTTPTLVLHRRGDRMVPLEGGRKLAGMIPGAHFMPLEGDAHFPWAGDWRSVAEPILDFLLEREGGGSSAAAVAHSPRSDVQGRDHGHLTAREAEVLVLIARGLTNREISSKLVLSERTVARHITNVYAKIGVRSKAEATAYAFRHGLT